MGYVISDILSFTIFVVAVTKIVNGIIWMGPCGCEVWGVSPRCFACEVAI
jgi:hypothetical protein